MTQEEKSLLLKDLCARLPYGVIMTNKMLTETYYPLDGNEWQEAYYDDDWDDVPYLRPMSNMTEEEKEEMHNLLSPEGTAIYGYDGISVPMNYHGEFVPYKFMNNIIHYLLEHHFDFMALIPKGLAIEVTEDNNPYKE